MENEEFLNRLYQTQSLVERFHRAKWIKGASIVSLNRIGFELTDIGIRRMKQIKALSELEYTDSPDEKPNFKVSAIDPIMRNQFEEVFEDLIPPVLSESECEALFALAAIFTDCKSQ